MRDQVLFYLVLIPSIVFHEVSHGVVALLFGDDTAKKAGRLTLNPIRHVDPFGTVILPLLLVFTTGRAFGWAKPVPVDLAQLRSPRAHGLLVSLAGPFTNLALALVVTLGFRLAAPERGDVAGTLLISAVAANVILAVFNLIPLPPLDGSALIEWLMPRRWWPTWNRFRPYSMGLLLVLVLLLPGVLAFIFEKALDLWSRLL